MHLYTFSASPNGKRVNVFLKEKGIKLPTTEIDIMAGENLSQDYRAKNPMARVPVLELDSGEMLSESVAISRYLEGLHPEPNLFGQDHLEQARIEMWNRRTEINLFLNTTASFRNSTGVFKDRETVCPEWAPIAANAALEAAPAFEQQLADNEFIAGDRFTIADITLTCCLTFARNTGVDLLGTPNLAAYHDRIKARPSFGK
jgi:glutathione S-transferase